MEQAYRVVGGLTVAGVKNGAQITQKTLDDAGANVPALLAAGHLDLVKTASRRGRAPKDEGETQ